MLPIGISLIIIAFVLKSLIKEGNLNEFREFFKDFISLIKHINQKLGSARKFIYTFIIMLVLFFIFSSFLKESYSYFKTLMPNENMDNEIAYLNLYPEGIYRQNVERNFEVKAYEKVIKDSAESSINIYIKYFPSGKNLKNVIIVSLKKHKNLYLIRKFIKDYPNSKYLSMAKKKYVEI